MPDGASGLFRMLVRRGHGIFNRTVSFERCEYVVMLDSVEAALVEDGFDYSALFRRAPVDRMNHRHGDFAFPQVTGDWFSQNVFRRGEIQHVVDDLKRESQIAAVFAQSVFIGIACAAQYCTKLHGDGEEAGGLAIDEIEMFRLADDAAESFHLHQFALDHLLGKTDEQIENSQVPLLEGDLKGLHV